MRALRPSQREGQGILNIASITLLVIISIVVMITRDSYSWSSPAYTPEQQIANKLRYSIAALLQQVEEAADRKGLEASLQTEMVSLSDKVAAANAELSQMIQSLNVILVEAERINKAAGGQKVTAKEIFSGDQEEVHQRLSSHDRRLLGQLGDKGYVTAVEDTLESSIEKLHDIAQKSESTIRMLQKVRNLRFLVKWSKNFNDLTSDERNALVEQMQVVVGSSEDEKADSAIRERLEREQGTVILCSPRIADEASALSYYDTVGSYAKKLLMFDGKRWLSVRSSGGDRWLAELKDDGNPQLPP